MLGVLIHELKIDIDICDEVSLELISGNYVA